MEKEDLTKRINQKNMIALRMAFNPLELSLSAKVREIEEEYNVGRRFSLLPYSFEQ